MKRKFLALALLLAMTLGIAPAEASERAGMLRSNWFQWTKIQMLEWESTTPVFGNWKYAQDEICSVTFLNSLAEAPEDAWDVSADGDGSVLAWVAPYEREIHLSINSHGELQQGSAMSGQAELFIAAEGGVIANTDSSLLFYDYPHLSRIDFNDSFITAGVEDMMGMFAGCASLTELDLSGFDTSGVVDMQGMFRGCSELEKLNLSSFNTSKVEDMGGMFWDCDLLENLDLSSFDTSRVTRMDRMFYSCDALGQLDLSMFDTNNVQDMESMFENCKDLAEVTTSEYFAICSRNEDMLSGTLLASKS